MYLGGCQMFEYELKKLNLSEKREQQLKLPYIAKDVETIRIMTEIYCHAHHNTKEGLCPECRTDCSGHW